MSSFQLTSKLLTALHPFNSGRLSREISPILIKRQFTTDCNGKKQNESLKFTSFCRTYKTGAGTPVKAVEPLSWLIGRWKSICGEGSYPTIKSFSYCAEISFEETGQPLLRYCAKSWNPTTKNPIHLESGFLRINPGTCQIVFMVAHNLGVTTLEEGNVSENELKCQSTQVANMTFVKDPPTVAVERTYRLLEEGNLEMTLSLATSNTSMTHHLRAVYEKQC